MRRDEIKCDAVLINATRGGTYSMGQEMMIQI